MRRRAGYAVSEETARAISTVKKSKSDLVLVTCTINRQHQVTFEIDTGASCNVLPFSDYVKATGDKDGHNLKKTTTHLTMHNNSSEYPMGRVTLCVKRNGITHYLHFYVVKSCVTPILGRHSCLGMQLIRILDSDAIHTVGAQSTMPRELFLDKVLKNFRDVFEGIGELQGEYTIKTTPDVLPVVHPPRKLPIALQEPVRN